MQKVPILKYIESLPKEEQEHISLVRRGVRKRPGGGKWIAIGLAVIIVSVLIGSYLMFMGAYYCSNPLYLSLNSAAAYFCLHSEWAWFIPYSYLAGLAIFIIGFLVGFQLTSRRFVKMPFEERELEKKKVEEKYFERIKQEGYAEKVDAKVAYNKLNAFFLFSLFALVFIWPIGIFMMSIALAGLLGRKFGWHKAGKGNRYGFTAFLGLFLAFIMIWVFLANAAVGRFYIFTLASLALAILLFLYSRKKSPTAT